MKTHKTLETLSTIATASAVVVVAVNIDDKDGYYTFMFSVDCKLFDGNPEHFDEQGGRAMEVLDDFYVENRQYLLHDRFGTVLGFDTKAKMSRVLLSIKDSGCASFEEWWNEQSLMFHQALDACGHNMDKIKLPKEYVLKCVNFRHFCSNFNNRNNKEA